MSNEKGRRTTARTMDFLHVGGRLMFMWSVFLGLLEVVVLFGATEWSARLMDGIAMLCTGGLGFFSVFGVRWATRTIERSYASKNPAHSESAYSKQNRAVFRS